ncbi:MAG TPA: phosphatidylglycerol lysyltransferase domain-containing protein [Nitrospira sp.]|jgi:Fe-S-cluster containining protein|nr:phosphatidylglycerol lysyltransferase domain-containing protein [Nitrospira sp.]
MTGSPLQIVPSATCRHCEVCCRFPEEDSFLRPFFTAEEIEQATAAGLSSAYFPNAAGAQIDLVPNSEEGGYICPAFDRATSQCRIYDDRPLDCRLYPFALMWDTLHEQVVLGWDTKCPYMRDLSSPVTLQAAHEIAQWLEADDEIEKVARYPRLVGRFQDDVIPIQVLGRLTERLQRGKSRLTTRPLMPSDRDYMEEALRTSAGHDMPLAAASFAYHFTWRHLLTYRWVVLRHHLCLFAESPAGVFMALPPLGTGSIADTLNTAFRYMRERNGDSPVTRVENVPAAHMPEMHRLGYRVIEKNPDYLYAADHLADLTGDAYRSPRAACNRFIRERGGVLEPYDPRELSACLSLFHEWREHKQQGIFDDWERALLQDAAGAHETAVSLTHELGLTGALVRVEGRVRAYTFGLWLSPVVFCVLLEVADRTIPGLAAFMFREFCRQARAEGACWINTMDDSGLPSLARSKQWYRPARLLPNFTVMES